MTRKIEGPQIARQRQHLCRLVRFGKKRRRQGKSGCQQHVETLEKRIDLSRETGANVFGLRDIRVGDGAGTFQTLAHVVAQQFRTLHQRGIGQKRLAGDDRHAGLEGGIEQRQFDVFDHAVSPAHGLHRCGHAGLDTVVQPEPADAERAIEALG